MAKSSSTLTSGLGAHARRNLTAIKGLFQTPDNETIKVSADAVADTQWLTRLFASEQAIIQRLEPWLAGKRMLDVGVGSGRTTQYFAPLVRTYVGVDYSAPMIESCTAVLGQRFSNVRLSVADARDLNEFSEDSFDLVLFSFLGLDCIGHAERLKALSEFRRVCASDGFVCFSAHNIYGLGKQFRFRREASTGPRAFARELIFQAALRLLNDRSQEIARKSHSLVRDGALGFRIYLYYVRPSEQIAQLHSAGFSDVEIYGEDGRRIACEEADQARDLSLYYLASSR
jgi:ubiquinone/menaquinone biosynthesis C-methylase UbiE